MTGFEQADTETLLIIRGNLLGGLEKVAATIADGTFETVGPKGAAPPAQSGQTTLALLTGIEAELAARAVPHSPYAVTLEAWSTPPQSRA